MVSQNATQASQRLHVLVWYIARLKRLLIALPWAYVIAIDLLGPKGLRNVVKRGERPTSRPFKRSGSFLVEPQFVKKGQGLQLTPRMLQAVPL